MPAFHMSHRSVNRKLQRHVSQRHLINVLTRTIVDILQELAGLRDRHGSAAPAARGQLTREGHQDRLLLTILLQVYVSCTSAQTGNVDLNHALCDG